MTQQTHPATLWVPAWVRIIIVAYLLLIMSPGMCWVAQRPGIISLIQGLIIPAALLSAYFSIFGRRLWVGFAFLSVFVVLAPGELAFIALYGHPSDYDIVGLAIESGPRETRDFLGLFLWPAIVVFTSATIVAFLVPVLVKRYHLCWTGRSRAYVVAAALVLPATLLIFSFLQVVGSPSSRFAGSLSFLAGYADNMVPGYPFGVPFRGLAYYNELQKLQVQAAKLKDFRFGATAPPSIGLRQIYVLVIGESSRRDHWSLFGYDRPTNPELAEVSNLVLLPRMITPWPTSRLAIPVMLTRKPAADLDLYFAEPSILRVYSEVGFLTYWFSNQLAVGQHDFSISATAYEAAHVRFFNPAGWTDPGTYDEVLLPALQRSITESSQNLFIVLHTMGSHGKYGFRYPEKFDRYQPSLKHPGNAPYNQLLLNSYDNSILYTDHILAAVIRILSSTDAATALFYSSDHGEDIPNATCNLSGHGNPSHSNFIIPALFWYSKTYAHLFPHNVEMIRENATRRLTTENIFETLVDLAGINLPAPNHTRSMFRSELHEQTRLVNAFGLVDFDHADISKNCEILLPP